MEAKIRVAVTFQEHAHLRTEFFCVTQAVSTQAGNAQTTNGMPAKPLHKYTLQALM